MLHRHLGFFLMCLSLLCIVSMLFLLGRHRYRAGLGVPGVGQRRVQPHHLGLPPAGRADPGGVAAEPDRQREYGLVGVPHCGSGQRDAEPRVHGTHQQKHHRHALIPNGPTRTQ